MKAAGGGGRSRRKTHAFTPAAMADGFHLLTRQRNEQRPVLVVRRVHRDRIVVQNACRTGSRIDPSLPRDCPQTFCVIRLGSNCENTELPGSALSPCRRARRSRRRPAPRSARRGRHIVRPNSRRPDGAPHHADLRPAITFSFIHSAARRQHRSATTALAPRWPMPCPAPSHRQGRLELTLPGHRIQKGRRLEPRTPRWSRDLQPGA